MTLTHELPRTDDLVDNFDVLLDKLIADGFELLKDLTGDQPEAFAGLYLAWYADASGLIRQLAPLRLTEFARLYRSEKRRRLDYENYVIEDYLLGVSLHGGFGRLDAMRAIAARRFHLQLLLLKSIQPGLRRGLDDLQRELSRGMAKELLGDAEDAAANNQPDLAVKLAAAALRVHARATFQRHELKTPARASLTAMAKTLVCEGLLGAEWQAMLEQVDVVSKSPVVLPAEVTESLSNSGKLIDQLH